MKNILKGFRNHLIELKKENDNYEKPQFKKLTKEQIDDIHSRDKITPAEKVKEWESMDLCAPGSTINSPSYRCKKFHSCHDCLVDYANRTDEYVPFKDEINGIDFNLNLESYKKESKKTKRKALTKKK